MMILQRDPPARKESILGLDLGANSVGWCLLSAAKGRPRGILAIGSRAFEAGMEGDISAGKGESRNLARREARQARRMLERRARRKRKLLHVLQSAGLLPKGEAREVIPALDRDLLARYRAGLPEEDPRRDLFAHVLPYRLRTDALDRKLELHELGRALYHLAQRRGYRSNRRAPNDDDKEKGAVKTGIAEIQESMSAVAARTLGEYLAGLDPRETRIRRRWTSRAMYLDEFDKIWAAQASHYPQVLTGDFKQRVRTAIFHQRPLKSVAHLVGTCALEPGKKRAAVALLCAQRFRLIQQVNNCKVSPPGDKQRPLTPAERAALVEALERQGDLTFTRAKKLLGLNRLGKFGFEEGGEKRFVGNRTNAKLAEVFGDRWWQLNPADRDLVVEDLRSFEDPEALARRGRLKWGLDEQAARKLAVVALEPGYANHSRQAIAKLLPKMEAGTAYATAVKEVYGEFHRRTEALDQLPPVASLSEVRNPVVTRVLAELRKVVNPLVARYGKPTQIRVELARDLRQAKQHRVRTSQKNRANERARTEAKNKILAETKLRDPRGDDILKVLLADECEWTCPYTGRHINMSNLFGDNPLFDIEHIVPFSRCLDDSYINKTLCHHEENRNVKGNRTPWEAYGATEKWEQTLQRVRTFKGSAAEVKIRRFQMKEDDLESLDDFTTRQLNDTRYASRLAMQYLATLYGGVIDASGRRRVQAGRGGVTRYVRQAYHLNPILGDGPGKSRDDHRHHAVDALAVALTEPRIIQALSEAAVRAWERRRKRRHFDPIGEPWAGFLTDVYEAVGRINTSHRVHRKVNGPLHRETNYAKVRRLDPETGRFHTEYHVRKPLNALSSNEVENIVDEKVKGIVKDELEKRGLPPAKAFAEGKAPPSIPPKNAEKRPVPIRSVRIRCPVFPHKIGDGDRERHVTAESNHHMEIVALLDEHGNETKWTGHLVDRLEAFRRLRAGEPVVRRDHGPDTRFKFSLAPGDTIQLDEPEAEPRLGVVRSVSAKKTGEVRVELVGVNDARKKADIKAARHWFERPPNTLRRLSCRKVTLSPLGEVRPAND